jgi:hypothetical protein
MRTPKRRMGDDVDVDDVAHSRVARQRHHLVRVFGPERLHIAAAEDAQ